LKQFKSLKTLLLYDEMENALLKAKEEVRLVDVKMLMPMPMQGR
jgi:hypothetical protein